MPRLQILRAIAKVFHEIAGKLDHAVCKVHNIDFPEHYAFYRVDLSSRLNNDLTFPKSSSITSQIYQPPLATTCYYAEETIA